ncbi:tryptophan dimethylallyltransferase family protein [Actinocrispum sp. NPDC049592]|uniref:tryptophan dimethylallyltransferase family protein n=1 Tax=Actinocrispum sp. NPDC049592 TaxID=3154835 RepID=UPI00341C6C0B
MLLGELLGAAGESNLLGPAEWSSSISDDKTPIEFSVAYDVTGERAVRLLGEAVCASTAREFLDNMASRLNLYTGKLDAVQDLFLPERPSGDFVLWYSMIFRSGSPPVFKVYLNPHARGAENSSDLVAEALGRLGMRNVHKAVVDHALTRGDKDTFSFFALDLNRTPKSRVKLYVSHESAETDDVERAAALVPGINPMQIREFCAVLGGGKGPFVHRPLISSYSFVEGDTATPSNYSLYLPVRDYVPDDEVARARLVAVMAQYNMDTAELDRSLRAVTARPLRDGVGLIPHVSLRLGAVGSGITVYLSSEAFSVTPPRQRPVLGLVS